MNTLQLKKIFRIFSLVFLIGFLFIIIVMLSKAHTVAGMIIIGAFGLAMMSVPAFMFLKSHKAIKLIENGRQGKLIIKEIGEVNYRKNKDGRDSVWVNLNLEVHSNGTAPYLIEKSLPFETFDLDLLAPGVELPAAVDRDFPDKIEFLYMEWRKSLKSK